jgi:hypothetical protein
MADVYYLLGFSEPKEKVNVLVDRFRDTWSKLRVFELIEYEVC